MRPRAARDHLWFWKASTVSIDEACRILGFSPAERIQDVARWHQRWLSLLEPENRARTAEVLKAALTGGPRYDVEYRVIHPGGDVRVIHIRGEVMWDEAGRPKRMFGMMQDITEIRQAERALRGSEARFRTILEHAADAFLLLDERLHLVDVNRQACDSLGYSRDELLGMHVRGFDVSLDAAAIARLADKCARARR